MNIYMETYISVYTYVYGYVHMCVCSSIVYIRTKAFGIDQVLLQCVAVCCRVLQCIAVCCNLSCDLNALLGMHRVSL